MKITGATSSDSHTNTDCKLNSSDVSGEDSMDDNKTSDVESSSTPDEASVEVRTVSNAVDQGCLDIEPISDLEEDGALLDFLVEQEFDPSLLF